MTLKDFLKEVLEIGKDGVSRVDVKENFSFFNTSSEHQDRVMAIFEDFHMEDRKVNVEISKGSGRKSGGRRRRGEGGGRGRRSEGFKPKGSRRSDRGRSDKGGNKGSDNKKGRDRRRRRDR